jgi:hypothetical protein
MKAVVIPSALEIAGGCWAYGWHAKWWVYDRLNRNTNSTNVVNTIYNVVNIIFPRKKQPFMTFSHQKNMDIFMTPFERRQKSGILRDRWPTDRVIRELNFTQGDDVPDQDRCLFNRGIPKSSDYSSFSLSIFCNFQARPSTSRVPSPHVFQHLLANCQLFNGCNPINQFFLAGSVPIQLKIIPQTKIEQ